MLGSFERLARLLRGLDELPLRIDAIQPASPAFRYTEPRSLLPRALQKVALLVSCPCLRPLRPHAAQSELRWVPALEAVISFESSGQWPDDVSAIRHLKTSFYLLFADAYARSSVRPSIPLRGALQAGAPPRPGPLPRSRGRARGAVRGARVPFRHPS